MWYCCVARERMQDNPLDHLNQCRLGKSWFLWHITILLAVVNAKTHLHRGTKMWWIIKMLMQSPSFLYGCKGMSLIRGLYESPATCVPNRGGRIIGFLNVPRTDDVNVLPPVAAIGLKWIKEENEFELSPWSIHFHSFTASPNCADWPHHSGEINLINVMSSQYSSYE